MQSVSALIFFMLGLVKLEAYKLTVIGKAKKLALGIEVNLKTLKSLIHQDTVELFALIKQQIIPTNCDSKIKIVYYKNTLITGRF